MRADAASLSAEGTRRRRWWIFDALPVPAALVGAAITVIMLVLLGVAQWIGVLVGASSSHLSITAWGDRTERLAVLVCLLLGYVPAARRYLAMWTLQHADELSSLAPDEARADIQELRDETVRGHPSITAGISGAMLGVVLIFAIDAQGSASISGDSWSVARAWVWILGPVCGWHVGRFVYAIVTLAHRFSALAKFTRVDLFDLSPLAPFVRQGLRSALLCMGLLAMAVANVGDRRFWLVLVVVLPLALVITAVVAALPVQGVHARIGAAKRAELELVNTALRGERLALLERHAASSGSPVRTADLLAYREFLSGLREWPFDPPSLLRGVLFVAIPIGSWLGGAVVENLLSVVMR